MAAPTGTVVTPPAGTLVGMREDLSDIIFNISPTETPFVSGIGKVKATNTLHEWQTDVHDTASNNKQLEGDDIATYAYTPPVRLGNYGQISRKAIAVSGTTEAVLKAGRRSEIAYQLTKAGRAIKTDMEFIDNWSLSLDLKILVKTIPAVLSGRGAY